MGPDSGLAVRGYANSSPEHPAAATHYVDVNSTNATPPYTNWSTATTNIQDASDFKPLLSIFLRFSPGDFALLIDGPFQTVKAAMKTKRTLLQTWMHCVAAMPQPHAWMR
jgi:hypothetical protein